MKNINIIGAGLAGCEAAYQISKRGVHVNLYDMKPKQKSPAHSYDKFAELVCSNSLRADRLENAAGLLKQEMRELDSLIMRAADATAVPAGGALAVDRYKFSDYITDYIVNNEFISVYNNEIDDLEQFKDSITIIATGPLTSEKLANNLKTITGGFLSFFDAAAPIVSFESIDMDNAFFAARYGKGTDDYINCPLTEDEYKLFWEQLINAEDVKLKGFEDSNVFEGCMPVEVMARRGFKTLLFGPLKPVGLLDPKTGKTPYAVVQLRKENKLGTMYNIVGFQTHLKFGEQKRVFSLIPALKNAEFLRYGVMHKNTYINSPVLLDNFYRLKNNNSIFFAGQITGVEGYIESTASGLLAGLFAYCAVTQKDFPIFTANTAIGALAEYVSSSVSDNFQPMNINFGIMNPLSIKIKKKADKNMHISKRALDEINDIKRELI